MSDYIEDAIEAELAERTDPSPLWCNNQLAHGPHSERNQFDGINYCTGRTDLKLEITRVLDARDWEYVPGFLSPDGRARVSAGTIAPGYVAQFIAEGGEVLRRRVGAFEVVTADTAPSADEE
ncbi:hypothetical protein D8M34_06745 [Microbacterium sp. HSID17254]|uniref:hypothetical protein n=1 Tax=Microbacterium sp. HSID17254 TaxID=2419509 RepID=UPI000F86F05A|nr:hypothetical protein [Microbacterium sp. HSID17254]RUQ06712.1 hypothetical protein D8M34_06745 [Microbacterium sp. HSID17254]